MATPLQEKRDELQTKQKELAEIFAEAGTDFDMSKVTLIDGDCAVKVEEIKTRNQELDTLAREVAKLDMEAAHKRVMDIGERLKRPANAAAPVPGGESSESIGQLFVKSLAYQQFKKTKAKGIPAALDIALKTLFQTSAGWAPESTRISRVIEAATRPIQVLDLIPMGQTGQAAVVFMRETTRTHAAAEKAEGIAYAESTFVLTEVSSTVRKVTDSIPVTDEQLEDEQQVRSYLDQRLRFGLQQRLDSQVLVGDGTAPNLEGILNATGIQAQAKGTDPTFDAIHKAMTKVRVTGRANPNGVILHPNDWETIRLTRTADGIYIMGNPSQAGPMTLFGLPVAVSDAETENTGLVGDFANFCQLHERRGIDVQVGYTGTQFVEGEQTLRADLRVAFTVYRPAAYCTVTGI